MLDTYCNKKTGIYSNCCGYICPEPRVTSNYIIVTYVAKCRFSRISTCGQTLMAFNTYMLPYMAICGYSQNYSQKPNPGMFIYRALNTIPAEYFSTQYTH